MTQRDMNNFEKISKKQGYFCKMQSDRACENIRRIVKNLIKEILYLYRFYKYRLYIYVHTYIDTYIHIYEVNRGIKGARSPIDNRVELLTGRMKVADGKNRRI